MPYKDTIELHGFSDASERAYGACIYVRTVSNNGEASCNLMCSKSRVAPLKPTTIPRLELCAALLLAQLMNKVTRAIEINVKCAYYWTDSTITLVWINSTAKQFKTFVANRVGEIQDRTDASNWRHVKTQENPADLLSRGVSAQGLMQSSLWWQGPSWLSNPQTNWAQTAVKLESVEIPERRSVEVMSNVACQKLDVFQRYSTLPRLQRVVAYCKRFIHNSLCHVKGTSELSRTGAISASELNEAMTSLIKLTQEESFQTEIQHLARSQMVPSASRLKTFNAFLDDNGIIRVGGRLEHSHCQYNERHPIVLPSKHPFTKLLIQHIHRMELHAGTQATLAKIRSKYWPLSGRDTVRHIIRNCVICFKAKPIPHQPIMGNLPAPRVKPARPFINVGVDYCGPFTIRTSTRRRPATTKAYVAIFVCMAVKAVHIELVSGLDSNSFINALKRFISRRGMISNIYSDNGSNFVGANKELKELRNMFTTTAEIEKITNTLSSEGISWHFIPPRAPHFGGLWEAAVKSFKFHFKRIIGNALLTFEEFYTIFTQIEASLVLC